MSEVGKSRAAVNPYRFFAWLIEAPVEELMKCDGVGLKTAQSIRNYFDDERQLAQLEALLFDCGITFEPWS